MTDSLHVINECVSRDMTNLVDNVVVNEYFIENEETEWMHTTNVQVDNLNVYNIQSNEELYVRGLFARKEDLVTKISLWSVKRNVQFRTDRSTSKILTLICYVNSQCQWRLQACCSKRAGGVWKITSYESHHSCHTPIENQRHRQLTSSIISRLILPVVRPIPRPPLNPARDVCFGARLSREAPNRTWEFYRNEFDVIEESQESYVLEDLSNVAAICRESSELWRAHVPIFCMAVMEGHMPERVWRQFGAPQVDVTFRTRELLITNLEASYLDVKKEILKLQEDTLNKLPIKIPEYEQPSIPSGSKSACPWPTCFLGGRQRLPPLPGSKSAKGRPTCKSVKGVGLPLADLLPGRPAYARERVPPLQEASRPRADPALGRLAHCEGLFGPLASLARSLDARLNALQVGDIPSDLQVI
ncbi:hypothetical protein Taro_054416 [Colocasia esculenta]|uniref:Transposase MuDR plant domain-containing protein n=1 Tax=Colocasia esculenta TaxID=4460 RepID=A0A843XNG0_COLES|nr:hypothetical protein [Colocasia esculenta]